MGSTRSGNPSTCLLVVDDLPPTEPGVDVTACGLKWRELRSGHHLTPYPGNDYIKNNKDVPEKYAAANNAWMNLSKKMAEYEKWASVLEKEKDLKKMESAATKATQQLADLDLEMLKLTSSYLPKIPGLKLKVRPSIDKDKEEIGLFYNDMTMAQLNESEFAKLWAKIYSEKDMGFLFFENVTSLGSGAIGVINELAKEEGVYVFASRMDRKVKSLAINFNSKIE